MSDCHFISCRELIDFIAAYLEGELEEGSRLEFERHLAVCPPCVAYVDSYRRAMELGREALGAGSPAGAVPKDLVRAILEARGRDAAPPGAGGGGG